MKHTIKPYKIRVKAHRKPKAYTFISQNVVVSENKSIIRVLDSENLERPRTCAASSILPNRKQRRAFFPQLKTDESVS